MKTICILIKEKRDNQEESYALVNLTRDDGYIYDTLDWKELTPQAVGKNGKGTWFFSHRFDAYYLNQNNAASVAMTLDGAKPRPKIGQFGDGFHHERGKRIGYGQITWEIKDIW